MGRPKRGAARIAEAEAEQAKKKAKAGLAVGDQLPDDLSELETDESTTKDKKLVKVQDIVKETGIVVFAYPKANTSGCTKQAIGFNEKHAEFKAAGFRVFGLSADKFRAQHNWKVKNSLDYTLLCDPDFLVIPVLGFNKGAKSINRSHIVIEKGGKVKDIQVGVKPDDSVTLALETVKAVAGEAGPSEPPADEDKTANGMEEDAAAPAPEAEATAPTDAEAAKEEAAPAAEEAEPVAAEEAAKEAPPADAMMEEAPVEPAEEAPDAEGTAPTAPADAVMEEAAPPPVETSAGGVDAPPAEVPPPEAPAALLEDPVPAAGEPAVEAAALVVDEVPAPPAGEPASVPEEAAPPPPPAAPTEAAEADKPADAAP